MFDPQMDLELDHWTSVISLAQLRIDAYAHAALGKCYGKCYGMVWYGLMSSTTVEAQAPNKPPIVLRGFANGKGFETKSLNLKMATGQNTDILGC